MKKDGYLSPLGGQNIGTITEEGIAFIMEGGYLAQLKKIPDIMVFISYSSKDNKDANKIVLFPFIKRSRVTRPFSSQLEQIIPRTEDNRIMNIKHMIQIHQLKLC